MARDLRQIGFGARNYPDTCRVYGSHYDEKNQLVMDETCLGRFKKTDIEAFRWERITVNGVLTNKSQFIGKVQTGDNVSYLRPDMFVKDQTGALFIVVAPIISDDSNQSKQIGTRPTVVTTFTLRGVVK